MQQARHRDAGGFTLIELVCTMVIMGCLSVMAIPRFVDLTADAYQGSLAATAASFGTGVRVASVMCSLRRWSNRDNLPGYGAGNVDFNAACNPTDTSGNANNIAANGTRCTRVWGAILALAPSITTATSGADYRATAASNVCTFRYLRDGAATRQFSYNALTGTVSVVSNP